MEMKNINLPLIALRGMTVLPDMVIHFDISRKKSIHAVEKAMEKDQKIFLATQVDPEVSAKQRSACSGRRCEEGYA